MTARKRKVIRSTRPLNKLAEGLVSCYTGNIKESAELLKCSPDQVKRMLMEPRVLDAIQERWERDFKHLAASKAERILFWTGILRDDKQDIKDRMKAAVELGKINGDYVKTTKIEGGDKPIQVQHTRGLEERMKNLIGEVIDVESERLDEDSQAK